MPPIKKFTKEAILDAAYTLAKNEGFKSINARRIARKLGCSVQPIFHNFASMEEVNKEVYKKIYNKYKEYMLQNETEENAYKAMGLSYIKFARDYPEFFKIIFMQKTNLDAQEFIMTDSIGEDVIKAGQKLTDFSYEEQKKFHVQVWVFTHGLACLMATKTICFEDEELEQLLRQTVKEMVIGYKIEEKKK